MSILEVKEQKPVSTEFLIEQDWSVRYSEKSHAIWADLLSSIKPPSEKSHAQSLFAAKRSLGWILNVSLDSKTSLNNSQRQWVGKLSGRMDLFQMKYFSLILPRKDFRWRAKLDLSMTHISMSIPTCFTTSMGIRLCLSTLLVWDILQSSARHILRALILDRHNLVKKIVASLLVHDRSRLSERTRRYSSVWRCNRLVAKSNDERNDRKDTKFNFDHAMRTEYNMLDLQRTYFVLDDMDELQLFGKARFFCACS